MVTRDPLSPRGVDPGSAPGRTAVLVTGGAGFIGSHVCVELLVHGYDVVVADNYANSSPAALRQVERVAGRPLAGAYDVDLRDRPALSEVFQHHGVDAVMHFAAMKAVGESMRIPLDYYDNNVGGTTSLLRAMREHDVHRLVFSSSCSIYGNADAIPIDEHAEPRPTNPYATSKWICEQMLAEACGRCSDLTVLSLRYFNPIGAHRSGLLGEVPRGAPHNIMPSALRIATGRRGRLTVFGNDYSTTDGTAVRDYIHVMDVADAHRVALEHLPDSRGMRAFNLGTGVGTSVLELIRAVSAACGRSIPYRFAARRPGDVPTLVADPRAVAGAWGWRTTHDLASMCTDAWRFQELNPRGYLVDSVNGASAPGGDAVTRSVGARTRRRHRPAEACTAPTVAGPTIGLPK